MRTFKGILFDLDGTLVKTMEDHFKAWQAVLSKFNLDITPESLYKLEGMRLQEISKKLFEAYNFVPPDPEKIVEEKEEYYLKNYKFELYPGVERLVDEFISKKILIGVVTAGLWPRVFSSIPQEFLGKFGTVITGEDSGRGKPFPDPYLRGAELLGLKPEECIVVENAPLGIKAAKSAGMYCIAVCTTLGRNYLEEADEIIEKFEDLRNVEIIKQMLNK